MFDLSWMFPVMYDMPDGSRWLQLPDGKSYVEVLDKDGLEKRFGVTLKDPYPRPPETKELTPSG